MMRIFTWNLIIFLMIIPFLANAGGTGKFFVDGNRIIAPDGSHFIAKGVNMNGYQANWNDQHLTISDLPLVKNVWKFNFVRLYCRLYKSSSNTLEPNTNQLYSIIEAYINAEMVVMLNFHDKTGDLYRGQELADLISFNLDIVNHFRNHPKFTYLWFEPMNEPGNLPHEQIDQMNRTFITAMRNGGAVDNIICAPGNNWSQEGLNWNSNPVAQSESYILSKGKDIQDFNEANWGNRNIIFSPHFYRIWVHGDDKMAQFIDDVHAQNLPLVIGEYGIQTPGGSTVAATQSLVDVGYERNVGRVVWSWSGGDWNKLTTSNSGRQINRTDGSKPTNLTWLGEVVWDDNHSLTIPDDNGSGDEDDNGDGNGNGDDNGGNLLINGDFSDGLTGWAGPAESLRTYTFFEEGNAHLTVRNVGSEALQIVANLEPGAKYILSGFLRNNATSSNAAAEEVRLGVRNHGDVELYEAFFGLSTDWTFVSLEFTMGNNATMAEIFVANAGGSNWAYADELSLVKVSDNPSTSINQNYFSKMEARMAGSSLEVLNVSGGQVTVYDMSGVRKLQYAVHDDNKIIDLSGLPRGVYVIFLYKKGEVSSVKVVNQ